MIILDDNRNEKNEQLFNVICGFGSFGLIFGLILCIFFTVLQKSPEEKLGEKLMQCRDIPIDRLSTDCYERSYKQYKKTIGEKK